MGLLNKKEITSSAEVVDKHLILSLPNAIEPVVWRMELDKIGTAVFEVKQTKNNDDYKLVLKPKKGTAETIATFNKKEKTLNALMHASDALQKPNTIQNHAKKEMTGTTAESTEKKSSNKWLYLLIGFLIVIGLYTYMLNLMPKTISNLSEKNQESANFSGDTQSKTGVPLSADAFLNGL